MSDGGTLTVYQRMPDAFAAQQALGNDIAKAGFFGCGSVEQGRVLAMECFARGMPPLMLAERYHIIQNKLAMKADAMLAAFQQLGGWHNIVEYSTEACEIKFNPPPGKDEQPLTIRITWADAQKEKWPYKGDGKSLKDNWATPLGRQDMMWARVVSRGVKKLRPEIASGYYTPEEISDFDDEPAAKSNGNGKASKPAAPTAPVTASVVEQVAATPTPAKEVVAGEVIDGDFEVVKDKPADEFTTAAQRTRIEELFDALGMTADQRVKAIAKRNASTLRDLKSTLADELIAALESRVKPTLPSLEVTGDPNGATCGPCTEHQEKAIKSAFEEWKQIDREACDKAIIEFKQKLHESGRTRILDLSANDAARLCNAIKTRAMGSFITRSLETWKPLASKSDAEEKPAGATDQKAAA